MTLGGSLRQAISINLGAFVLRSSQTSSLFAHPSGLSVEYPFVRSEGQRSVFDIRWLDWWSRVEVVGRDMGQLQGVLSFSECAD